MCASLFRTRLNSSTQSSELISKRFIRDSPITSTSSRSRVSRVGRFPPKFERDDNLSPPTSVAVTATPGGLLTVADDGALLTYNSAQQVIQRALPGGGSLGYSYDDNGARVEAERISPAASTTYSYDPAGTLAEVELPSQTIAYETDARGLRQTRTTSSTENFLWSTARPLPVLTMDDDSLYIYGPTPTPIAQIDKASDDAIYLHTDILGSVRATTDETGATLGTQTFTEFGSTLSSTGSLGTEFGYTGNWTDEDTGMVHLRARDYDPKTRQFLSVDPALEDTRQPYAYAGNNPAQFTDHTGLDFWNDAGTNALAFGAGLLNGVTMGASGMILSAVVPGYDCFVEANSGFYTAGDVVGMVATTVAFSAISAGSLGAAALGARLAITSATRTVPAAIRNTVVAIVRSKPPVSANLAQVTQGSGARFVVNSTGENTVSIFSGSARLELSPHAAQRITERNVQLDEVIETLGKETFEYFHNGVIKTAFYDPVARLMLGSVDDVVTTVMTQVKPIYIQNLRNPK